MINFFYIIVLVILEIIAFDILIEGILNIKLEISPKKIAAYLLLSLTSFVLVKYANTISHIYFMLVLILFTKYFYEQSMSYSIYITLISQAVTCLIAYFIMLFFNLVWKVMPSENINVDLICLIANLLICIIAYFHLPLNKIFQQVIKGNRLLLIVLVIINIIYFISTSIVKTNLESFKSSLFNILLNVLFGITFILINYIFELRLEQKNKQIADSIRHSEEISFAMDNMLATQHEHRNHIQFAISLTYVVNDIREYRERLIQYFKNHNVEFESSARKFLKIDNKEIASLISFKMAKAENLNLLIEHEVENINTYDYISNYDLNEVLGCLLDNAIEASKKGDKIILKLFVENRKLHIEVRNEHEIIADDLLDRIFEKNFTSKKTDKNHKRGYGLYNVQKIASKYKGIIKTFNDNTLDSNFIVIKITIPPHF